MKNTIYILSAVFLLMSSHTGFAAPKYPGGMWHPRPDELSRLIHEALRENLSLQQKAAETAALGENVSVAGALEDPMLTLGLANLPTDTYSFRQEPMTQKQIAVSQKIPWFGKRDLLTQKAVLRTGKSRMELAGKRVSLARKVSEIYYELGYVREALDANTKLQQMMSQMLRVAESGYANGRSPQQDVLQAQVELGKLMEEKSVLDRKQKTLVAGMNELFNKDRRLPLSFAEAFNFPEISIDTGKIEEAALERNPVLLTRQIEVDLAEVDIAIARKNYYPDMNFKVGYGFREEDAAGRRLTDFVSGSVTIPIPVWKAHKQDRALAAAKLRRTAAMQSFEDFRSRLPHRIASILAELDEMSNNYRLYRDLLVEQADLWSQASLAAYQVGKIDFDTMIKSQIRKIRFELQKKRFVFSSYQKLTELDVITGILPAAKALEIQADGNEPVKIR